MFYRKRNVSPLARVFRVVTGTMMIGGSILMFQGQATGYILGAMGAIGMMTGLVGYCPACAMLHHETSANTH